MHRICIFNPGQSGKNPGMMSGYPEATRQNFWSGAESVQKGHTFCVNCVKCRYQTSKIKIPLISDGECTVFRYLHFDI